MGEGWWIASDGKWYPPESHPDAVAKQSLAADATTVSAHTANASSPATSGGLPVTNGGTPLAGMPLANTSPPAGTSPTSMPATSTLVPDASEPETPPTPGWWKAADGNWYAPELHPTFVETVEVSRPGHSAVTRSFGASAPGGVHALTPQAPDAQQGTAGRGQGGAAPAPADLDFDPMLDFETLFGGLDDPPPARPASPAPATTPVAPSPSPGPTSAPPAWLPSSIASAPRPTGLRMPDHGSFNAAGGAEDSRSAEAAPGATTLDRPVSPGFGQLNAPPPGSTIHEKLPGSQLRSQGAPGEVPLADGFDELLQSVLPASRPPQAHTPDRLMGHTPDRLMGLSDEPHAAWTTSGGPSSAVPPMSPREADFFVMKPSHKKHKATQTKPRAKLSLLLFLIALLVVLAAVAVVVLYIHH